MKSKLSWLSVPILFCGLFTGMSISKAEDRPHFANRYPDLLYDQRVVAELDLSAEQKSRLAEIHRENQKFQDDRFAEMRGKLNQTGPQQLSRAEGLQLVEETQLEILKFQFENYESCLLDHQLKRLDELTFQSMGVDLFFKTPVVEYLDLTVSQQKSIEFEKVKFERSGQKEGKVFQDIRDDLRAKKSRAFLAGEFDEEAEIVKELKKVELEWEQAYDGKKRAYRESVEKLLTGSQLQKYERLLGAKFEFERPR